MIKFLVKRCIKDYENVSDRTVRERYGILGGILGICCNLILFAVKLLIGFALSSMAIIADAFNNLSDMGSSLVSLIGAKMSNRRPDKEHPFGHGRIEYISALIVSFIIMLVGFQLFTGSIDKIIAPEPLSFNFVLIGILLLSTLIKVWMFLYNRYLGNKINSEVLRASATDSLNDVLATLVVIVSAVISHFTGWYMIDGIMSLAVSVLIFISGFHIAKDVVSTILGTPPDPELVRALEKMICSHQEIVGIHDLVLHDYGPGRVMASVHAEVPDNGNIVLIHEIIDDIERDAMEEFGIVLVIHTDPVSTNCAVTTALKELVTGVVTGLNPEYSIHDFRITDGENHKNLIFDLLVPAGMSEEEKRRLTQTVCEKLQEVNPIFRAVIHVDTSFI